MGLIRPLIVAPDTSHWANWIDDAIGSDAVRRSAARRLHAQMLDDGRVPFLSWHHLEELLCVEAAANAQARVAFLQTLPMIGWMRMPGEQDGLGGITDILAAEAVAFDEGCSDLVEVRDRVRSRLMRTGPAMEAVGGENWVWNVARPVMMSRRPNMGMVSALSGMQSMDARQTVGQLAQQKRRPPSETRALLVAMHARAVAEALQAEPKRDAAEARTMADEFVSRVSEWVPTDGMSVRDLIVATHVRQGLDPEEVRDDCTIAELSTLGTFRSQLRVVAEKTGIPFNRLKRVRMESLPSWRIGRALQQHGQQRTVRPGSDLHDQHLAVLAAYTDELFVDKRTHEDFRRVMQKEPTLSQLFGRIVKASRYGDLAHRHM